MKRDPVRRRRAARARRPARPAAPPARRVGDGFALGGEAALRELEREPFDVVVSRHADARHRRRELLGLVQERIPATVRIILSGQPGFEAAVRAVPVAHQFLAKPCDTTTCARRSAAPAMSTRCSPTTSPRAAGRGRRHAVAARVYTRLVAAHGRSGGLAAGSARSIESDSPCPRGCCSSSTRPSSASAGHLEQRSEAVRISGWPTLRALVLTPACSSASPPPRSRASPRGARRPSRRASAARRRAAPRPQDAGRLTAGMLHDLGKLLLASHSPDELPRARAARANGAPAPRARVERSGVDHAEVGAVPAGPLGAAPPGRPCGRRPPSSRRRT